MAYRIQATTTTDLDLLLALRDLAWERRLDVSEVMRQAFQQLLDGPPPAKGSRKPMKTKSWKEVRSEAAADDPHFEEGVAAERAKLLDVELPQGLQPEPNVLTPLGWLFSEERQQYRDPEGIWHDQLPT